MPSEKRDAALEAQNLALRREFRETLCNDCFSAREIAEALGVTRQRIGQLREERHLVGFRFGPSGSYYYPRWQVRDGAITAEVDRLSDVADECGYDGVDLHLAVTSVREGTTGGSPCVASPARLLGTDAWDEIEQMVRAWGDIGA
jgi:hypothetical protein